MRPTTPAAFALAAVAALVALAPAAAAAAEDAPWRLEVRDIAVASTATGFTYSSDRESPLGDDLLSGAFQADPPRLEARLTARDPDAADGLLRVEWRELVEYRDADGDGRFGLADPVTQRIALAGLPASTVVTPVLGGQTATVTYTLPANESGSGPLPVPGERGTLRLTFTLVASPANIAGHALDPTDLGLGADVRGFAYVAADTSLALVSDVATPLPRLDHEADGVGVSLAAGALTFRLAWDDAVADGVAQPAPVTATSLGAERVQLVQSWPRGEDAVGQRGTLAAQRWSDVGAVLESLPPGDWRFYALGLAAVAVGLGVPSLRRLRGA